MNKFDNDNVYVELQVTNLKQDSTIQTAVSFEQSFTQPIIGNTTDYKLAIVRFNLDTLLPVFIPLMVSTTDKATTSYSITMSYDNNGNVTSYSQNILWEPQNLVNTDQFYYCYSFEYFAMLINTALTSCLDGLIALGNGVNPASTVPVLNYNSTNQLFELTYDYQYFSNGNINLYFNNELGTLLQSFLYQNVLFESNVMWKFIFNNYNNSNENVMTQEISTIALFSPISMVVFKSNLLPITSSITPPIVYFVEGQQQTNSSSYNFSSILTDFLTNDLVFNPNVQYTSQLYRWIDLKPNFQINKIDLSVFWINRFTGALVPLYLPAGASGSVKILLSRNY